MKALTVRNDTIAMFVTAFQILLKLSAALQIELYPFWWCSPIFLGEKGILYVVAFNPPCVFMCPGVFQLVEK